MKPVRYAVTAKPYKEVIAAKLAHRDSQIPAEWRIKFDPEQPSLLSLAADCGLLTDRELKITEDYDSVALLAEIANGVYTSLEVAVAFCKRAAIAQQALNCLTEVFFDKAIERAKWLDEQYHKTGTVVGPLHGLPISLKDTANVKGQDSLIGIAAYAFQPEKENSVVVDIMEKLGAVMYVKTNVPQSMMVGDTDNNIFGRTRNPIHKDISASGSSGGLAALIKFRGSLLGVGTDAGGSGRVPAYNNGIYGMKPSSGRLPYHDMKGFWEPGTEVTGIPCVNAPMAVSYRDCKMLLEVISKAEPWKYDPSCQYLPWIEPKPLNRPLSIGVIRFDGEIQTMPPVERTLNEVTEKLKAAGHDIVELELYRAKEISQNIYDFFTVDGGKYLESQLKITGEPMTDLLASTGMYPGEKKGLSEFYAYSSIRAELQREWLKYWENTAQKTKSGLAIDAILVPIQPFPPRPSDILLRSDFSKVFNLVDYPALVFQAGAVDLSKDDRDMPPPINSTDEKAQTSWSKPLRPRLEGFPIGLQLVAQRQMEPKLFQVMDEIAKVL